MLRFCAFSRIQTLINESEIFFFMPIDKPNWIKDKKVADDFEVIQSKKWDDYKDFRMDDGCYVLIKIHWDTYEIGVAVCDYNHVIQKEFRGRRPQDIWHAIFGYMEVHKKTWFKKLDHAAYLGKELKKAEICMSIGTEYVQE